MVVAGVAAAGVLAAAGWLSPAFGSSAASGTAVSGTAVSSTAASGAVIALADQYAGRDLGFVNPALYRIASTARYHTAFHDITRGNNTVKFPPQVFTGYRATRGWDPVTGLGSPDARVLVPLLAHDTSG